MFEAVFSFRGRLNRLQYLASSMALGAVVTIAVVIIGVSAFAQFHGSGGPPSLAGLGPILLIALLLVPPFFWVSFSLQARRFRDIGWNPVLVIPLWLGVLVIDQLVAMAVPAISLPLVHRTIVGVLFNLAMGGSLLFWPGHGDNPAPPMFEDPWTPAPPAPEPRPAMPQAAPIPSYRPAPAAPAAPRFGRRGLSN
jgi:uncharacterized membrane protein YhaH (DUF805 family)